MVEENIPEEFNPDEIEIPTPEETRSVTEIILKKWKPQGLLLFPESIEKCQVCGFYKRVCNCIETKQEKKSSFKVKILLWVERIKIKYHKSRYNRLMQKSNKFDKKSLAYGEKAIIHREFRESKINWEEVEFEGIEIKQSKGI